MKKIMLVGDSIRQGYDKYVKMALEGSAEVEFPKENCRFTVYILRNLGDWLKKTEFGEDTDVLHWNAGLWDCARLFEDEPMVPLELYKYYMERICRRIQLLFPKAKVIFATSTPIDEEGYEISAKRFMRYNKEIEEYNAAAVEIVKKYGFAVNDLYGLMKDVPKSYHSDKTHFYTKEATKMMTEQVIKSIQACVDVEAKELDYDALFDKPKEILGA